MAPSERSSAKTRAAEEWLGAVRAQERRGEFLTAFDLAQRGLAEHPDDVWLKHRAVLALARAGATEEAARRFGEYALAGVADEDIAALQARIAKDLALSAEGDERRRLGARAAELYGAVFAKTGGYYPAINAATLSLVAGEAGRSRELAAAVLEIVARSDLADSYYLAATEAEARLLLRDEAAAATALDRAAALHGDDYAAVSTTRRQLRMICDYLGLDPSLLIVLAGPDVVHFCGHRLGEQVGDDPFSPEAERAVASHVAEVVSRNPPGFAYGSLASGADIIWAEALLAHGSELHAVLPFAREEFLKWSVAPAGRSWVERFERCLAAASSIRYATDDAYLGDDALFRYASEFAMGLALLRARYLDAEVRQLAVWDGQPARGAAGTAIDVATWRRAGRPVTVVSPVPEAPVLEAAGPPGDGSNGIGALQRGEASAAAGYAGRTVRAMVFGDFQGFSKLTDEQLPVFAQRVLGAIAEVLGDHDDDICNRNTWGDALYVVLSDAAAAAACALDLQAAMAAMDLEAEGLPPHLALRIGCHLGPVFSTHDPVLDQTVYMGSHVSRTARIEPVTPPGAVYVTEPFAAALVLDGRGELACDYVGHMEAAKDYGALRMYRLRRIQAPVGPATAYPPPSPGQTRMYERFGRMSRHSA